MLKDIKVLDEREIYFSVAGGQLEVYDQKDRLVGERPLPIVVSDQMSVEEIYRVAEHANYDVPTMISDILNEAVMDNRIYDILLQQDSMIFFSPSANQFVSEPYEGIFQTLEKALTSLSDSEIEAKPSVEEVPPVQEELDIFVEDIPSSMEDALQDENIPTPEPEIHPHPKSFEEKSKTTVNEYVHDIPEDEPTYPTRFEDAIDAELVEDNVSSESSRLEDPKDVPQPSVPHLNGSTEETVNTQTTNPVHEWKEAFNLVLRDSRVVDGTSIKELRDKVVEIVLSKDVELTQLDERELLLELMDTVPLVFDGKLAVKAGLYQAKLMTMDGI